MIYGDILEADLAALLRDDEYVIYGSLPYYITSPILHHLFQFAELIDEIHVVVQTEVAERMAAEPGSKAYGYFSVATQLNSRPELVLEIPRAAFPSATGSWFDSGYAAVAWRMGAVAIAVVCCRAKINPREHQWETMKRHFWNLLNCAFRRKRKTLVNNLRELGRPGRSA